MLSFKDRLEIFGTILTSVAIFIGVIQFWVATRKEQLRFLADRVKEFNSLPEILQVKQMLDWVECDVQFAAGGVVSISQDSVLKALRIPNDQQDSFSDIEVSIRHAFDAFFDSMEMFAHYSEARIVRSSDLQPFLGYWFDVNSGERGELGGLTKAQSRVLWRYMEAYGFESTIKLLGRLGYNKPY